MSWALRYRRKDGSNAKLTLGKIRLLEPGDEEPRDKGALGGRLTLKQARLLAANERAKVDPARDLAEAKQAQKAAVEERTASSFEAVAIRFIERYAKRRNRESWWKESARLLGFKPDNDSKLVRRDAPEGTFAGVVHHWGQRPVQEIGKGDVNRLLQGIVDNGAGSTANNVLAVLRRLFNWLIELDTITVSPCAGVKPPAPRVERDHVLSDKHLALVWRGAEALGEPFGPFVQLLLLTGQRRDEVAEMRWSELDLEKATWSLSRARVKNDTAHQVPLSDQAAAVLRKVKRILGRPDFVFTSRSRPGPSGRASDRVQTPISGFSKTKARLDAEILKLARKDAVAAGVEPVEVEGWVFHDLRRTVATGLQRLGVPVEVTEACLNHKSGKISGIARVYQRYDFASEKAAALAEWGTGVDRLLAGEPLIGAKFAKLRA